MKKPRQNGDPEFQIDDQLTSTMTFDRGQKIEEILSYLKRERFSGALCMDINIGGINRIRFSQKRDVDIIT